MRFRTFGLILRKRWGILEATERLVRLGGARP